MVLLGLILSALWAARYRLIHAEKLTKKVKREIEEILYLEVLVSVVWPVLVICALVLLLGVAGKGVWRGSNYLFVIRPRKKLHPHERIPTKDGRVAQR